MAAMACRITGNSNICWIACSSCKENTQELCITGFCEDGWRVDSLTKGPIVRKVFPCHVFMWGPWHAAYAIRYAHGFVFVLSSLYNKFIANSCDLFDPLGRSDAIWRYGAWPTLVQAMACRLFGTKLLAEPRLTNCHQDYGEQTSVKFGTKYNSFNDKSTFTFLQLKNKFTSITQSSILYIKIEIYYFRITAISPRDRWFDIRLS